jgi:hypothetical protein
MRKRHREAAFNLSQARSAASQIGGDRKNRKMPEDHIATERESDVPAHSQNRADGKIQQDTEIT